MEETIIYISKRRLIDAVGLSYRSVLKDLMESNLLKSWADVIELRFDKDKALHIQSLLEFYDTRDIGNHVQSKTKVGKKEE